ncbi:hypothetical protein A2Z33_06525 [Candidatus Gottesmanbacteria bacterium RBG_16_52_11]|uniref:Bacterial Ig-like domain-containing protein n=1 Tax=Candidatus Gottesmanbacteria bacterium RBG_16_52_11 TaxID=1798374 RepID=A0A1F5YXW3_9BACT|nr:MAG: hypothetical protein A2Z33_06525 [Candidatus Gottesmanbacteria bacterium RBG_16_52_11]
MKFISLAGLCFVLAFLLAVPAAFASGFQVKTVGSMNVDGVTYDHLWYTSGNVTFTGIGVAGSAVTATVDGTGNAVTVDADGNWSFATTLTEGDHSISFSSDAGSRSFTLTIGPVPEGVGALTPAEVPTAGAIGPTLAAISAGSALLLSGMFFGFRRNH